MAVDLGSVFFSIDARFIQVDRAVKGLNKVHHNARRAQKSVSDLSGVFKILSTSIGGFTAIRTANALIQIADRAALLDNRIRAVTNSTQEFTRASEGLLAISRKTGTVLANNAQLYQRLSISADSLNATQEELLAITEVVGNLGRVSGSTAEDVKNSTRQLAQGLGSTFFRAEEFNSIIEQMPAVIEAVAHELGTTASQVNMMVKDGELLSKDVFQALLRSQQRAREEAEKLPLTLAESSNIIKNNILLGIGQLNKEFAVTTQLGGAFQALGDLITISIKDAKSEAFNLESALDSGRQKMLMLIAGAQTFGQTLRPVFVFIQKALNKIVEGWRYIFDGISSLAADALILSAGVDISDARAKFKELNKDIEDLQRRQNFLGETDVSKKTDQELQILKDRYAQVSQELIWAKQNLDEFNKSLQGQALQLKDGIGGEPGFSVIDEVFTSIEGRYEENYKKLNSMLKRSNEETEDNLPNPNRFNFVMGGSGEVKLPKTLEEFNKLVKNTDIMKIEELKKELETLEDVMAVFGSEFDPTMFKAFEEAIQSVKDEIKDLSKEGSMWGESFLKGITQAIEQIGPSVGDSLAAKLFGEDEVSFKEIARNFVKSLLSSILQELLINPMLNDIKSVFGSIFNADVSGGKNSTTGGGSFADTAVGLGTSLLGGSGGTGFSPTGIVNSLLGNSSGGATTNNNQKSVTMNITTTDADSFQLSRGRIKQQEEMMMRNS